jgi:phage terminase large subunit GpA-like protein
LTAKNDTDELRVFVNTVLAEGWGAQSDEIDEGGLTTRAEPFSLEAIPVEALALTCGVDVQSDCLEVSTVAWDKLGGAMVLDHRQILSAQGCQPEDQPTGFAKPPVGVSPRQGAPTA